MHDKKSKHDWHCVVYRRYRAIWVCSKCNRITRASGIGWKYLIPDILKFFIPSMRCVKQTTWVWCPGCGTDLCSQPGVTVTDEYDAFGQNRVTYTCWCGRISIWDFDHPAPICIDEGD